MDISNVSMAMFATPAFWLALMQIIMINIMLSGDNAVVIALASRSLPPRQQKRAVIFGSVGAIVLRVILTFFAVLLLELPYLKLLGGAALLWIAASMLNDGGEDGNLDAHSHLWSAIRVIIVADFIMSLDNVIGVAAAAKGNIVLLVLGLGISIPLIIWGSQIVLKLMHRFPVIIVAGAALLGWVAGEMLVGDEAVSAWIQANAHPLDTVVPAACAVLVVVIGKWMAGRSAAASPEEESGGKQPESTPAKQVEVRA
jgi:YjbE family integral membrane protein